MTMINIGRMAPAAPWHAIAWIPGSARADRTSICGIPRADMMHIRASGKDGMGGPNSCGICIDGINAMMDADG